MAKSKPRPVAQAHASAPKPQRAAGGGGLRTHKPLPIPRGMQKVAQGGVKKVAMYKPPKAQKASQPAPNSRFGSRKI